MKRAVFLAMVVVALAATSACESMPESSPIEPSVTPTPIAPTIPGLPLNWPPPGYVPPAEGSGALRHITFQVGVHDRTGRAVRRDIQYTITSLNQDMTPGDYIDPDTGEQLPGPVTGWEDVPWRYEATLEPGLVGISIVIAFTGERGDQIACQTFDEGVPVDGPGGYDKQIIDPPAHVFLQTVTITCWALL